MQFSNKKDEFDFYFAKGKEFDALDIDAQYKILNSFNSAKNDKINEKAEEFKLDFEKFSGELMSESECRLVIIGMKMADMPSENEAALAAKQNFAEAREVANNVSKAWNKRRDMGMTGR